MVPYLRTYSLVRFSVYDSVKNHFEKTGGGGPVPVYKLAIAGSIAGAAGGRKFRQHSGFCVTTSSLCYSRRKSCRYRPRADDQRCQPSSRGTAEVQARVGSHTVLSKVSLLTSTCHSVDGLVQITKQEGFSSLFRGLTPNVTRAVLMNASQLASYDFFKRGLLKTGYMRDNMLTHFTSSILAVCSISKFYKR